jgi:hypothetical protein
MFRNLTGRDPNITEVAKATLRSAILDTESAFATITGETRTKCGLDDAFGDGGTAHIKRLASCWYGGLSDRLRPYAYEIDPDPPAEFIERIRSQ